MKPRILGLTGYYCSGKSTVEKILADKYGYTIIDADKVGHAVLDENVSLLTDTFGQNILTDGKIDRKLLGSIVFSDKSKLAQLNALTHPLIFDKIRSTIADESKSFVVSAALYFQTNCDSLCSRTLIVTASRSTILQRGMLRDGHDAQRIKNILDSQELDKYLTRKDVSIIHNDGKISDLEEQLSIFFEKC